MALMGVLGTSRHLLTCLYANLLALNVNLVLRKKL